jgi:hypothetical protein
MGAWSRSSDNLSKLPSRFLVPLAPNTRYQEKSKVFSENLQVLPGTESG